MKTFINELLKQPQGQIIACNILDGLERDLYDEDFVKQLVELWKEFCDVMKVSDYDEIIASLNKIIFTTSRPKGISHPAAKRDFKINCIKTARRIAPKTEMTTIVSSYILGEIVDIKYFKNITRKVCSIDISKTNLSDDEIKELKKLPSSLRKIRLKDKASIGLHPGLVWYTSRKRLENVLANGINQADQARDSLGLIHHKKDRVLYALHFSVEALSNVKNGRPTFADAGTHARFRTRAERKVNQRRGSWGHTVDLDPIIIRKNDFFDGLPERVSDPLGKKELAVSPVIEFTPLGIVKTDRGKTRNDNDKCFADHLYNGRSKLTIKKELLNIL